MIVSFPLPNRSQSKQKAEKSYPEATLVTHYTDIRKTSRPIDLVVIHCSATREDKSYTPRMLIRDHVNRGYLHAGYHFYITRDGTVHAGRPLYQEGAHATGFNRRSIGICYEGGLDASGKPADTRTPAQKVTLLKLLQRLKTDYPHASIKGHRELGVPKDCPCFKAGAEYAYL